MLTEAELQFEFTVTVETRLGELCGKGTPTPEQQRQAELEAFSHIRALAAQENTP